MKKYISAILVLLIAISLQVIPVLAWDDCPFGMVNDSYPGSCPRYIDTNNDGICDHSQSAPSANSSSQVAIFPSDTGSEAPTLPGAESNSLTSTETLEISNYSLSIEKLSLLSFKELKALTIQELEKDYNFPTEPLLSFFAAKGISLDPETPLDYIIKEEGLSRAGFLSFLIEVCQGKGTNGEENGSDRESVATQGLTNPESASSTDAQTPSTPTPLTGGGFLTGKNRPAWWTRGEAFALFSTLFLILLLKGFTLLAERFPRKFLHWFTVKNYRFLLNVILLVSFSFSFTSGLMDYLSLNLNLFSAWGKAIVALHYNSSFVMLLVGVVHAFWHIPYYRGCLRQGGKLWKKNKKALGKWALNLVLALSFAFSIASGLLNYGALWFHWRGVASPSLAVHIYSSLVMMAVSVLHTLWHLEYYKRILSLGSGVKSSLLLKARNAQ